MSIEVIGSPCIGICRIHPIFHICRGCKRTPLDIRMWPLASNESKKKILAQCALREELYGDIKEKL